MFIDLTFFGKTAEFANKYFRKGSGIVVEGRLQFEQWQDQNGQKRSKHSIAVENVEFPPKDNSQNQGDFNGGGQYGNSGGGYGNQQQQGGYNNSGSNQYGSGNQYNSSNQGGYEQQQPQQKSSSDVPAIDVNSDIDDQVPF
jgi:single-strand DNA-binding protein